MLTKQAKILNKSQIQQVLAFLDSRRHSLRNKLIFLLSFHSGLRACEIADLKVVSVLNSDGAVADSVSILNSASKGKRGGRLVYLSSELREVLIQYLDKNLHKLDEYLIRTERSKKFSANGIAVFFKLLYNELGIIGASSHSGRRSFLTQCARKVFEAGGSLRDVQNLAGHSSLNTTQRYIQQDVDAQRKVVNLIYQ